MRVAFDTNVLAYAEGIHGVEWRGAALAVIRRLPPEAAVVPVQVLGELFYVLTRKGGKSRDDARDALLSWRDTFPVVETSAEVMLAAVDLAADHQSGNGMQSFSRLLRNRGVVCFCPRTFRRGSPGAA